jgi:hypothetical protein
MDQPDVGWKYRITLDNIEWPAIDQEDEWLRRSIYRWVMDNC